MLSEKKTQTSGTKNCYNWNQNGSDRDETLPKCAATCEESFGSPPGAGNSPKTLKNAFFPDLPGTEKCQKSQSRELIP